MPDEKPAETFPTPPEKPEALKEPKAKAPKEPEAKEPEKEPRKPIHGIVLVGDYATQHPMLGLLQPDIPVPVGQTEAEQDAAHAMVKHGGCRAVPAPTGFVPAPEKK